MAQQQQGKVRFVRVRGRIVPIRDNGYKGDKHKDYKATASLGAMSGAAYGVSAVLTHSGTKFGPGLGSIAGGLGTVLSVAALAKSIVRTSSQKKGKKARTFFGHYFAAGAGSAAGMVATGGLGLGALNAAKYLRR